MKLLICTQAVDKHHPALGFFVGWIEAFASHFEEVHVICLEEDTHKMPDNVFVYSLGKENGVGRIGYVIRFYRYFWHLFITKRIDFVFFHMGAIYNILAAPFFFMRKLKHTKFYWWKTHGKINVMGRIALMFVDRVYTAADFGFKIRTPKKHVIGHAIDDTFFTCEKDYSACNKIIMVGRIVPIKKVEIAIDVIATLKNKGHTFTLELVGPYDEGSTYYKEIMMRIKERNVEDWVHMAGGVDQSGLRLKYQEACILLHPAYEAGMDKVVLEAASCGVIPLSSGHAYKHYLDPFDLYVDAKDVDAFCSNIERISSFDIEKRNIIISELRDSMVKENSVETLFSRIFAN